MDENSYINKNYTVYFSYAGNKDGNSELEKPIKELRKLLSEANIDYRDYKVVGKTPFTYRRPMMESEEEIGRGYLIVVVLSVSYIESSHCMYEWYNIVHNPAFEKRIFPIYLDDLRERLNDPVRTEKLDVALTNMYEEIALKEAKHSVLSNEEKFILNLGNKAFKKELEEMIRYYRNNSVPKLEGFDYKVLLKQIQDRIKELEPSTMDSPDEPLPKTFDEKQVSAPSSKIATQSNGHCLTSPPSDTDSFNVIGREDDLKKLWEKLSEKKHVLLTGLGGIGKTKLAQMLFHNYRDQFEEVAWIKYKEDLRHSFSYHIEKYQNVNDPWEAMMNDLHNDGKKKLFIIDNVDDDTDQRPENDKDLRNLTGWKDTAILLTSRLEKLEHFIRHELKPLGKESCVSVFNHYYDGNEPDPELVGKIVELANYHTLTIELLAKSAKRENLESYYKKIKSGFEAVSRKIHTDYNDENATIVEHLKFMFDMQQRSDTDKKVLNVFAVLPVNCECSLEEIEQWFGFKNEDLDEVIKDGWLSFDKDKQTFSMHPLIRTIIRFDFLKDGQGKRTIAPEGTTDKILEFLCTDPYWYRIDNGYVSLQQRIDITESIISSVVQKETETLASVFHNLGYGYEAMGDYDKALEYCGKAKEIRESKLGKDHPDTAMTYNNIGEVYRAKGDYDMALEYYEKDRKIRESKLGKDHPETAMTYSGIALVYRAKGDYDKALEYYRKTMEIVESKLGKDHPLTAATYNNIAFVYKAKGDYGKALVYYRKALEITESKLGKDHPDIATTYDNIAGVYDAMGDFDKALEYFGKALEIRESKLGKDHPDTATTYNNIALVYQAKGDYNHALEYYGKAQDIFESKLGKVHPDTATTYNNIARVYDAKGDYDNALEYFGKALEIYEPKLGKDHPNTAITYDNIGTVYLAKGDYGNALVYIGKAQEIFESKLGKDHPDTATTYNNIAMVYEAKGDYYKALEYLLKALRIWLIKIKNHPNTISCFQNLATCYQAANMKKDFGEWLKERLDVKEWAALLELIVLFLQ